MGSIVPLLHAARKRRAEGGDPCDDGWRLQPLIVVALVVLGIAAMVLLGIRLPAIAITLGIGGLIVMLALAVLLVSLRR